ncbi:hypothetical protein P7C73_g1524, partial [Tremellales sp. Uapishka_1]
MSTEHLLGDVGIILEALMGPADGPRREAEMRLQTLLTQYTGEILLLLAQIGAQGVGGFQLDHRLLSLILLKRLAFRELPGLFLNESTPIPTAPFDTVRETMRSRIEKVLCAGLADEMDVRMRKGLGSCAAGWAQESALRQRPCTPLPPLLFKLTGSPHPFHRFTPFQLLDTCPTLLIDSLRDPIPIEQLASIILNGINDPSVDVRVEAIKALRSILLQGVTGQEREVIGAKLVLGAFNSFPRLPASLLSHALLPMADLASLHPNLFLSALSDILPYLLSILSPPAKSLIPHNFSPYLPSTLDSATWEEIANPSTEIILSLAELRAPQIGAWNEGRVGREFVGLLLARLIVGFADEGEDCKDWLEETDLDEEDESYPALPEEALDRLAMSLGKLLASLSREYMEELKSTSGGEAILPSLSEHVQALLQQADWRGRYTALVAIASIAEGSLTLLKARLRSVLTLVSGSAKDPHPRVRYAFLQCIGQLCTDLEGMVQADYPKETLEITIGLLADPTARVRAHAAACLTNFFQNCPYESFSPYIKEVIASLLGAFNDGPLYVQEQIVLTIGNVPLSFQTARTHTACLANIATTAGEGFKPFYRLSVGKATFAVDSVKLAQVLIAIQNQVTSPDDPRSSYLIESWSNICQVLGTDFEPFLRYVVPPLLIAAAYSPSRSPLREFSANDDEDESRMDATNTAEMEEKELAFEQLTIYAYQMRASFEPYLMEAMRLSLEALTFNHSEQVREAAAFLVPGLLQVAKEAQSWNDDNGQLEQVFSTLVKAMTKEVDFGFLRLLYQSFTDSLHVISLSLPPKLTTQLLKTTKAHLVDLQSRREDRESQGPYMDESDREMFFEEQEEENECLEGMGKALDMVGGLAGEKEVKVEIEGLMKLIGTVGVLGLK